MADVTFPTGEFLVQGGTALPGLMTLRPSALSPKWMSVPDSGGDGLGAQLAKAGWTFFYMAGTVNQHAFGFDAETRLRTAVGRVVKDVQSQGCNCFEITHLANKSFLGIPYVSITAHARHIQDGCQFRPI